MSGNLRMLADENMPGMDVFTRFGTVTPFAGRALRRQDLADTDILLVRSVTRVDADLLEGTPVRFVGSATIGTDHVDLDWLARQGIAFAHAPGCNAMAVVEYVLQVLLLWCRAKGRRPEGLSLGIVGVGHVGSRLARVAAALGLRVLACDPPRQRAGDSAAWASLDEALACDVVSLHVPLEHTGSDVTRHLLGAAALARLHAGQLLINSARGPVIDNQALLDRLHDDDAPTCVLDVWEHEPHLPPALLDAVWLGTPHVAGYSVEGKLRGSWMLFQALGELLHQPVAMPELPGQGQRRWQLHDAVDLLPLLELAWQVRADDQRLRASLVEADPARAFDRLRKTYPLRHELAAWQWNGSTPGGCALAQALAVQFA